MDLSNIFEMMPDCPAYELQGNMEFDNLSTIEEKMPAKTVTFLLSETYLSYLNKHISIVITTPELAATIPALYGVCITENPKLLFFDLHDFLSICPQYRRAATPTSIGSNCRISPLASIAESNVSIGDNVIIEEFVVVRENTTIGSNCIIRTGTVIGGHGFSVKDSPAGPISIAHVGGVILGEHVEIQHNTIVDRALYPWDSTVIGDFCVIDNLVHIAHSVRIGAYTKIVALSGIGGRVTIGERCWIGFQSVIRNGLTIGNNARVNMGAVVTKDVSDGESVTGNFAIPHDQFIAKLRRSLYEG